MTPQPTGTVTLLFTDVEGSTRLLERLGTERYADVLEVHRRLLRAAISLYSGFEVGTEGDSFFVVFQRAEDAVAAAGDAQRSLETAAWPEGGEVRVRMGLHTGAPLLTGSNYVGMDVHRAARIAAAGHGGQVLVSAATAAVVDESELQSLGEHRFKDLAAAERVYQLGEVQFPPIRSLYRTHLPVPATPFVGRGVELAELVGLLKHDDTRLATVTGPGGSGKTRLAVQGAADVAELFPDGLYWVPLAPIRDASGLEATIAQALEVGEQPGATPIDSVVAAFGGKRALVVFDNCEHLVDAVAEVVRTLLNGCPRLLLVCTSRERLGLRAERLFAVPPMALSDGVLLFAERAWAVSREFMPDEHVAVICEAVDELPLAIELAAARVRSMSTRAIRERLAERLPLLASGDRDVDERQRTLEATIAWSYNLLTDDERRALRALSAFVGGCTLNAADAVASADLVLLESLVDKSLVRYRVDEAGQDRYWLLETIREYAGARLREAGEEEDVQRRHRQCFVGAAADLSGDGFLHTGTEVPFFRADRANYRLVLLAALADADAATALSLAASLAHIWHRAGEVADGYTLTRAALALSGGDDATRGRALQLAADMAVDLGELDEAHALLAKAEGLALRLDDKPLLWRVYYTRSYLLLFSGEFDDGVAAAALAVEAATRLGSATATAMAAQMQVQALRTQATADPARPDKARLEECLTLAERLFEDADDVLAQAFVHGEIAVICFALARFRDALHHLQCELELRRASVGSRQMMSCVFLAGVTAGALGDHETGIRLASAALAGYESEGFAPDEEDRRLLARLEADARSVLGEQAYAAAKAGRALDLEEAVALALTLRPKRE